MELEMKDKQETLEEVAEKESEVQGWGKYESTSEQYGIKQAFIKGAKWQQERMYSEEEVFEIIALFVNDAPHNTKEWFEQFKKK
jgi:hypothetical protein